MWKNSLEGNVLFERDVPQHPGLVGEGNANLP